ncbi:hypothetical protein B0J18DRAFT_13490 [Chaetomium sp. MPI-SDFR-AT-0129]|nr:hypothetical protein B0J18DRAFT_13490 [Chaetomium sp. MPI-SDFR-AT-0129]
MSGDAVLLHDIRIPCYDPTHACGRGVNVVCRCRRLHRPTPALTNRLARQVCLFFSIFAFFIFLIIFLFFLSSSCCPLKETQVCIQREMVSWVRPSMSLGRPDDYTKVGCADATLDWRISPLAPCWFPSLQLLTELEPGWPGSMCRSQELCRGSKTCRMWEVWHPAKRKPRQWLPISRFSREGEVRYVHTCCLFSGVTRRGMHWEGIPTWKVPSLSGLVGIGPFLFLILTTRNLLLSRNPFDLPTFYIRYRNRYDPPV